MIECPNCKRKIKDNSMNCEFCEENICVDVAIRIIIDRASGRDSIFFVELQSNWTCFTRNSLNERKSISGNYFYSDNINLCELISDSWTKDEVALLTFLFNKENHKEVNTFLTEIKECLESKKYCEVRYYLVHTTPGSEDDIRPLNNNDLNDLINFFYSTADI